MAGIFGCFGSSITIKNEAVCYGLMQRSLAGFDHTSESKLVDGGLLCLGYSARRKNPDCAIFSSRDDYYTAVVCGELFLPSGEEISHDNFESEFLRLFEQHDKDLFLDCDGSFVVAFYDGKTKSLHLISDPFGNFALHYASTENGFLFSSQQHAIAEALGNKEFTDEALAEYISLGQRLEGRTFYRNIFRLRPASILTVDQSGSSRLHRYYKTDYGQHGDTKEQLRIIEEALLHAMDIRIRRPDIAFGLSGGLDSRISLATIKRLGKEGQITAVTHGIKDSFDMRIAARLAEKCAMPRYQLIFDDEFFADLPNHWKEVILLTEGGLGIESTFAIASWKKQSEKFGISMESHGGPLYRRQILKAREHTIERAKNFPAALFGFVSTALGNSDLIKPDLADHARKAGMHAIEEYFSSDANRINTGDNIDRYYLEQMSANRYSLSANAQIQFIGLSHPLLSLKAFDAATKIPESERRGNVVYTYLLNRFAPELKNVWVDNSGYAVPYYGYRSLRYVPPLLEMIMRNLPGFSRRFSLRRPATSERTMSQKNFEALKELLLQPDPRMNSIFIRSNIEKAFADLRSGKKVNPAILTQAANLQLLLELFA